jgi:hypothetical protein
MATESAHVFAALPDFDEMVESYRQIVEEAALSSR